MNLLFLTPQIPFPPRQGTAIRNWGLISHLAARHQITLLTFVQAGDAPPAPELRAACSDITTVPSPARSPLDRARTLLSAVPDLARRLWSPDFAAALRALLTAARYDLIQIEGLEMAPYLAAIRAAQPGARILYDAHNAEYLIQERALEIDRRNPARWAAALYSALQLPRLRRFEAAACRQADAVTCVSEDDARSLRRLVGGLQPEVVANGIALADYQPAPATASGPPRLVFTGKMDYRPNIDAVLWFAEAILPRIRLRQPDAEFVVVGQRPAEAIQRRHGRNGMVVTGAVDDARPFIREAAVYVAPLRMGGGTRFKLLEAMALERPVVSTSVGAEGFTIQSGRELWLADDPAAFADAVLGLLTDRSRARALGQAGREFVRAHYTWSTIIPRLEAVHARLLAR